MEAYNIDFTNIFKNAGFLSDFTKYIFFLSYYHIHDGRFKYFKALQLTKSWWAKDFKLSFLSNFHHYSPRKEKKKEMYFCLLDNLLYSM